MGIIIRFTHKKCKFEFNFKEGLGVSLFRKQCQARINMCNGYWGKRWQELIKQYPEGTATTNNVLCYCEKCKKYFDTPRIVFYIPQKGYHYKSGEDYSNTIPARIIYRHYQPLEKEVITCPNCNNTAIVIENTKQIPCPVCGKMRQGREYGNWD